MEAPDLNAGATHFTDLERASCSIQLANNRSITNSIAARLTSSPRIAAGLVH